MILTLYKPFRHWSEGGSVYILSDTHFGDSDCKLMDKDWIKKVIDGQNQKYLPMVINQ